MRPHRIAKVFSVLSILLAICLSLTGNGGNSPRLHAGWSLGSSASAGADLDHDGKPEEYLLAKHSLTVREGGQYLWRSPSGWRVDSFALDDVDNDGTLNLIISLWKKGSYGPVKPFWLTGEDNEYKNHIFVYRLKDEEMRQVWCSSALDRPVLSFTVRQSGPEGRNELTVREGRYRRMFGERYAPDPQAQSQATVWQWDGWGFRRRL